MEFPSILNQLRLPTYQKFTNGTNNKEETVEPKEDTTALAESAGEASKEVTSDVAK